MAENAVDWSRQRNWTSVFTPDVTLNTLMVVLGPFGSGNSGLPAAFGVRPASIKARLRLVVVYKAIHEKSLKLSRFRYNYRKTNERVAIIAHEAHHGVDMSDWTSTVEDELWCDKELAVNHKESEETLAKFVEDD